MTNHLHTRIALVLLFVRVAPISVAQAENWPTWRGLQQDGISREQGLPLNWSQTENIAWRLPLPGAAPSTPVVWNGKIFLTSTDRDSEQVLLLAIDVNGTILWQRQIGSGESEQAEKNNLAAPSPCTDGKHVWAFTGDGNLTCHNLKGTLIWQFHVEDRYEKVEMRWGMASSPTPYGDLLYLQLLHLNSSRIIALDKITGTEVWNIERKTEAQGKCMRSYATPIIYRDDQREYLLTQGQDYIVAHNLHDGRELWRCGDFHPRTGYDPMMHMSASPVAAEGIILVPSGNNGNFQALRPNGHGLITGDENLRLWHDYISPMRPSALLVDSVAYVCQETGVLHCLDAISGEQHYKKPVHRHTHHASPVYGDGKIYFASRDGVVTVVQPGTEFKILATNDMEEPLCASPAISDGRIYLRTFAALYAIEDQ
jgi:outer membrane protein assembly factor BamB